MNTAIPPRTRRPVEAGPPPALPALDLQLLADLPSLELRARYMVEGFLSGQHRSPQKGSSVEFAEYRSYQLGDDLRRADWRLYARTDRLHIKQFEEETQLRVFLVLDASASMNFQSPAAILTKVEYARLALAGVGLVAQRQRDAFGLAVAGTELNDYLPARSSTAHWRRLVGKLEAVNPRHGTALAKSLEDLAELIPSRSLVVIASDFYEDLPALEPALRRLRFDHHDLIGLHVLDPQEIDFDMEDGGTFVDAESGARLKLDPLEVRDSYLKAFNSFCAELDRHFRQAGGELIRMRTDSSPVGALARCLAERERRL